MYVKIYERICKTLYIYMYMVLAVSSIGVRECVFSITLSITHD